MPQTTTNVAIQSAGERCGALRGAVDISRSRDSPLRGFQVCPDMIARYGLGIWTSCDMSYC